MLRIESTVPRSFVGRCAREDEKTVEIYFNTFPRVPLVVASSSSSRARAHAPFDARERGAHGPRSRRSRGRRKTFRVLGIRTFESTYKVYSMYPVYFCTLMWVCF